MTLVPDLQKGLTREALQQRLPAGAARNAIDCALWSLEAAKQQTSLTSLLGVVLPESVVTAQTVVIGEPEQMAASAKALYDAGATLLKVKLDDRLISERMVAIRSAVPPPRSLLTPTNPGTRRAGRAMSAAGRPGRGDAGAASASRR
jgi:L-alanine-DL-glutamate epimerase-like enolase superfamily enzyme